LDEIYYTAYYLPRSSLSTKTVASISQTPAKTSFCEWKGRATYWDIELVDPGDTTTTTATTTSGGDGDGATSDVVERVLVRGKAWSYESPTPAFQDIKGYLAFYASRGVPWECYVDEDKVEPQPGEFYGGWSTPELVGVQKGGVGTLGW
jgi:uncharacterized protein (DUF427 family)